MSEGYKIMDETFEDKESLTMTKRTSTFRI